MVVFFKGCLLDGVGVGDVPEEEGVAGHGGAGGAAVLALDDLAEFLHGHLVAADLDEGADDGAHHVAQEAVGSDGEYPLVAVLGPLGMGDAAVVGLDVGVQFGEGGEVGVVQQAACGLVHQVKVKVGRTFPTQGIEEGILAGNGEVFVGAASGVKAGMGIVMDGRDVVDSDVLRQQGVEAMDKPVNVGNGLLGVKVGDHQAGIDAGVGAARARHGRGRLKQRRHRLLDDLLHRGVLGLHLPPVVAGAPEPQFHKIPHCDLVFSP